MHACRLCLGAWSDHGERTGGFYACNRYETAKQEGAVGSLGSFSPRCLHTSSVASEASYMALHGMAMYLIYFAACSMMRLRSEGIWLRTLWRDTLIIMNDGQPTSLYV